MDSGVHMHLAVTTFQGSLRDAASGHRTVRRSGPTSAMAVNGTGSVTGLDRWAGLDAGEG